MGCGDVASFRNLETRICGRCRPPFEPSEMIRVIVGQRENMFGVPRTYTISHHHKDCSITLP